MPVSPKPLPHLWNDGGGELQWCFFVSNLGSCAAKAIRKYGDRKVIPAIDAGGSVAGVEYGVAGQGMCSRACVYKE